MHTILKRTWVEVNLDKVKHNLDTIRQALEVGTKIMPVIKADAYGHGAVELAKVYEQNSVDYFAVSNLDEALQLRKNKITLPILILGFTPVECAATLAKENITQAILNKEYAETLNSCAIQANVKVKVHIKIDTGMSRIGFFYHNTSQREEIINEIIDVCSLPGLIPEGIFMHFASADEGDHGKEFTKHQFSLFSDLISHLETNNIHFQIRHCCNSAAIIDYPNFHLDLVRPGIILYGLSPSNILKGAIDITPVMELKSIISLIKEIPENTPISYGRTYVTSVKKRIATIPIGYADGYPRLLSGKADVLICGKRAPIVGRICMDQMMVDVTNIPQAKKGCIVTMIGKDGSCEITLDELAALAGTINYELACNISKRVPRLYLQNGKTTESICYI